MCSKSLQVEWKGLSGPISLKDGHRREFKLELVKLRHHNIVKAGEWTPVGGLNISEPAVFYDSTTMNVTLVVITILVRFFFFYFLSWYVTKAMMKTRFKVVKYITHIRKPQMIHAENYV